MKKVISLSIAILMITIMFVACSKLANTNTTTSTTQPTTSTTTTTTQVVTESTTEDTTVETQLETTITTNKSNEIQISVNESLDALENYYGKGFKINGTVQEGNVYYFTVYDKKNVKYAKVSVDLTTGEATEKIIKTNEENKINLLV